MIKKFPIFESTLRDGRREFKISKSMQSERGLNKLTKSYENDLKDLTKWQKEKSISFMELVKSGVYISQLDKNEYDLSPDEYVIEVKKTTFNLKKVKDVLEFDHYRVYKIFGLPNDFPSKYAIISSLAFRENHEYNVLNLRNISRGNAFHERVMVKLIAEEIGCNINNGITTEEYNEEWREEMDYYNENFSDNKKILNEQTDLLINEVGVDFDIIKKDYSDFFINKKARELFNKEYRNFKFMPDKWNPSDIWLIKGNINKYEKLVNSFEKIEDLNNWLGWCIKMNDGIIGVSLKLTYTKNPRLDIINLDGIKEPYDHKYIGYVYKPSTMCVKIIYQWVNIITGKESNSSTHGKIDIRNFNGGSGSDRVGLELKFPDHTAGKLTSSLNYIFEDTNLLYLQDEIVNSSNKSILKMSLDNFNLLDNIEEDFMEVLDNNIELDYKEKSKLQGLLIVNAVETHEEGPDWVVDQMVNYGRSQTDISAPFYFLK